MTFDAAERMNRVRTAGLRPVYETLIAEGFNVDEASEAVSDEPGIHSEEREWPGFGPVLDACRTKALAARYARRFAWQPPEAWAAIEAEVPPEEREAHERLLR